LRLGLSKGFKVLLSVLTITLDEFEMMGNSFLAKLALIAPG
jgi:hypothetical protein